jgi:glycosyltransferase involved in cell wall biosynthesis
MYKSHRVAVVMPIHNEQGLLLRAVARVPSFVDCIVAVDDGSTDATWQHLSTITDAKVRRLRHEQNRGVGAATKTGYRYSLQTDADLIAVMDGDGQMEGGDLSRLLDAAIDGVDYVKGNRFIDSTTIARMPWSRFIGNKILSWLTRRAAAFAPHLDAQCGYTVIRRAALKQVDLDELYDRYGFPNEMFFAARRAGLTVASIPIRTIYGDEISGINPFTAVPMIGCLIARGYFRRLLSPKTSTLLVQLQEPKSNPTN